jgi:hypothetical protein
MHAIGYPHWPDGADADKRDDSRGFDWIIMLNRG